MSKITFEGTKKEFNKFMDAAYNSGPCLLDCEYCPGDCNECLKAHIAFIPAPRWRAKLGDMYYYISAEGEIERAREDAHEIDNKHYDIGNYYKTEEQTEAAAERVRAAYIEQD